MSEPTFGKGKTLSGAFRILEEVARCGAGVTAQELSANLGMPKATTYRILNSLVQEEYLERLPSLHGFALGRKVSELAIRSSAAFKLTQAAKHTLASARSEFRGGLHLIGYDENRIQILDRDPDVVMVNEDLVVRHPQSTAIGRLMLASLSTRVDVAPDREDLDSSIRLSVSRLGYATQIEELVPGFGCLAVPVVDVDKVTVGCLSLSTSVDRLREPDTVAGRLRLHSELLAPFVT